VLVETVNGRLGRNTDSGDEELGALLNDDGEEVVELAVGVVFVGLAGRAADLGEEEVDTERSVLVVEVALKVLDLAAEVLGTAALEN